MTEEEYVALYEKHQTGTCTPAEQAQFDAYLATADLPDLPWQPTEMGDEAATQAAVFQRLQRSLAPPRPIATPREIARPKT